MEENEKPANASGDENEKPANASGDENEKPIDVPEEGGADWTEKTGLDGDSLCGLVETIVFMSDAPVSLDKIAKLVGGDVPGEVLAEAVAKLRTLYEEPRHGIVLQEVAQGFQFRTKQRYAKYIPDILKIRSLVLSSTALEVLAVIAYKQPVSKTEIDKVRGVDSSYIIRGLIEKRLIKVIGRDEGAGRPTLYGTTREFLELFNLVSLADLPPEHELQEMASDKVGEISDIKELVSGEGTAASSLGELQEIDGIEQVVRAVPSGTDFTRQLNTLERESKRKKKGEDGQGEDGEARGAFDVLDEFMEEQKIRRENVRAVESEVTPLDRTPS